MGDAYRIVLTLHVLAIISWMAGILYLFRILVYAAEKGRANREIHALLSLMATRLYKYITNPAMVVAWVAGITMISMQPALLKMGWLHVKLLCVVLMSAATGIAGKWVKRYRDTEEAMPASKTIRIWNEIPTLLMIIIVAMVILKPF